jgi:hypothetical protein
MQYGENWFQNSATTAFTIFASGRLLEHSIAIALKIRVAARIVRKLMLFVASPHP